MIYLTLVGKSSVDKTSKEFQPTVDTAPNRQEMPRFCHLSRTSGMKKTQIPEDTMLLAVRINNNKGYCQYWWYVLE